MVERISFNKLILLLTNQPFFIWNTLPKELGIIDEKSDDELLNKFEIPSFFDEVSHSLSEIQVKAYGKINEAFLKYIQNQYLNFYIIKSKKIEDKILETEKALKNDYDVIIDPVFEYIYKNHQIIATPKLFFPKLKKMSELKMSSSNKRKDYIKCFFDYNILSLLGFEIKDVSLFTLACKKYQKNEIDFFESYKINRTKASRTSHYSKISYDFFNLQKFKTGNGFNNKGIKHESKDIIEYIKLDNILPLVSMKNNNQSFYFDDIKIYLNRIIEAKKIKQKKHQKIFDVLEDPSFEDNGFFEISKFFVEILKIKVPEYYGYNLKIIKKENIFIKRDLEDLSKDSSVLKAIIENRNPIVSRKDFITNNFIKAIKTKKIIWYDFEAFSLPMSMLEYFLPFQQIVSQVSIIFTNNMKKIFSKNIVIDPSKISGDDFVTIINSIYDQSIDGYVVYNQSYENTRLDEMVNYLLKTKHPQAKNINNKVKEIIYKTIDLAEIFKCNSKSQMPLILIPQLKGKHSIKLVEKYITKNLSNKLNFKIKEYSSLEVQNGLMAMEQANNRALNIIKDHEWEKVSKKLKAYCQNDVEAMILVFYLIDYIVQKY